MGKIAFLFAGQGSQYAGMGKDLYDSIPEVQSFFDNAESVRPGTLDQMFSGSEYARNCNCLRSDRGFTCNNYE